jgi:hypothetical protein
VCRNLVRCAASENAILPVVSLASLYSPRAHRLTEQLDTSFDVGDVLVDAIRYDITRISSGYFPEKPGKVHRPVGSDLLHFVPQFSEKPRDYQEQATARVAANPGLTAASSVATFKYSRFRRLVDNHRSSVSRPNLLWTTVSCGGCRSEAVYARHPGQVARRLACEKQIEAILLRELFAFTGDEKFYPCLRVALTSIRIATELCPDSSHCVIYRLAAKCFAARCWPAESSRSNCEIIG